MRTRFVVFYLVYDMVHDFFHDERNGIIEELCYAHERSERGSGRNPESKKQVDREK